MDQQAQSHGSGSYTANLLGNIKSHLAGLQGYDVMALELIQNADDAKAESIIFDITDSGLFVINSGAFTCTAGTAGSFEGPSESPPRADQCVRNRHAISQAPVVLQCWDCPPMARRRWCLQVAGIAL